MAREIYIKNTRLLKRALKIEEILAKKESWHYGYADEHGRMTFSEKDKDAQLMLFDSDMIGRGIQIVDSNRHEVHLALSMPATKEDVVMLYEVARQVANLWKTDSIMVEEDTISLSAIESNIDWDIKECIKCLENSRETFHQSKCVILPCAIYPLHFSLEQLMDFSTDYDRFSVYLHEKQSIGAFISSAIYAGSDGAYAVFYVVYPGGAIILPKEPAMKFSANEESYTCAEALVAASGLFPGGNAPQMDYQDFLQKLSSDKITDFDEGRILVGPFTREELIEIFKQNC